MQLRSLRAPFNYLNVIRMISQSHIFKRAQALVSIAIGNALMTDKTIDFTGGQTTNLSNIFHSLHNVHDVGFFFQNGNHLKQMVHRFQTFFFKAQHQ